MRSLLFVLVVLWFSMVSASRTPFGGHLGRDLLQTPAAILSTCYDAAHGGPGCDACPYRCESNTVQPGSCVLGATAGYFLCKRCKAYDADTDPKVQRIPSAVDGSCGCSPGYYLDNAQADHCTSCPPNFYCPGGTESQSVSVLGNPNGKIGCPTGMKTRNGNAASVIACVNAPGHKYVPPTGAGLPSQEECPENTFCTGYRRQAACTPCPGGLKTTNGLPDQTFAGSNDHTHLYTDGAGDKLKQSAADCLVPPGFYAVGSNKVSRCPRGEYREGYAAVGSGANKCTKCYRGSTTYTSGIPLQNYCDELIPGYYWTSARPCVAEPCTAVCPQGSYCPGGYAAASSGSTACPNGMWTRSTGAKLEAQCLIPPGHKKDAPNGNVVLCATNDGEFSPDWRPYSATGADTCKTCGKDIKSEAVEPMMQYTVAADGFTVTSSILNVPRTSASCYIEQGEGMLLDNSSSMAAPTFRKVTCLGNKYGVANKTYELRLSPCKECPKNMKTDATSTCNSGIYLNAGRGYFAPQACCADPGYGYDGVQAAMCAKGTYNDAKTDPADQCKPCPEGTTTLTVTNAADNVNAITDCLLTKPGYGKQDASEAPGGPLKQCPVGKYSVGDETFNIDTNCKSCSFGRVTRVEGASSPDECDVCPAGSGTVSLGENCAPCSPGFFGDPNRAAGVLACTPCPGSAASTFTFQYNGDHSITVNPITEMGATSAQQCLLEYASIVIESNWYLPDSAEETWVWTTKNIEACMQECDNSCQFFTYDYAINACYIRRVVEGTPSSTSTRIAYKVIAGNGLGPEGRRRSLLGGAKPKEMGSGVWSWFIDSNTHQVGADLTISLNPALTVTDCLKACNDEPACAAVVLVFALPDVLTTCSFKQGVVAMPQADDHPGGDTGKRSMIHYRYIVPTGVKPPGI